jgi:hypothetical protein
MLYDLFILAAYRTVTDGKPMLLWLRTAWPIKFDESVKSPLLRFIINIQACHQTMNVVPIDKVTFHPLSLYHGCSKRHWLPFVTEPLSKICCTSIAAWLWVPSSCPGLAAKVKVVGFPDKRVHVHDEKNHITNARYFLHCSHSVAAFLLRFSQETTVWNI